MSSSSTPSLLQSELYSLSNLSEIFAEFDSNDSGSLPVSYAYYLVKSCFLSDIPQEVVDDAVLELFGRNTLEITRDMYYTLVSYLVSNSDKTELALQLFNLFTQEKQVIVQSDLKAITTQLDENISTPELNEMISVADLNDDGEVDFSEFLAILKKTNFL
ncbi:hypothetical protein BB561_001280 [Smittium simulii]|uniref:EF-hand domain-containing protein n=1 Tax=Smittium simulii TaxID=133385 RepID=A0A2T9YVL3_9FUNG|nr:hypothetical protein BB561_001280 [Smittium simulii]